MKRLSWKYIAGLIDGEGCLDLQISHHKDYPGRPYVRPRLRVTMAENAKFVLDILNTNFGGGLSVRPRKFDNPNWQDAWEWSLHGKSLRVVLQNIVNHMYIKQEQAKLQIWMIDNLMGKHLPEGVKERLNEEIKAMKRDPHRLSEVAVADIEGMMSGVAEEDIMANSRFCKACGRQLRRDSKRDYHTGCKKVADAIVGLTDS